MAHAGRGSLHDILLIMAYLSAAEDAKSESGRGEGKGGVERMAKVPYPQGGMFGRRCHGRATGLRPGVE